MEPPYPCPTETWRNDVYPAIDATQPSLSQAGRTIVITGAGSGIERETALTFTKARAKHLVLIGRTEANLLETQKQILENTPTSSVCALSVSDEAEVRKVADAVAGAYVYALISGAMALPVTWLSGQSAYQSAKVAQVKIMKFLADENLSIFFCSVHPGFVDTKVFRGAGADPAKLPMDASALSANFLTWLSQSKSKFLNRRLVWANWDVDELSAQAEKIQNSSNFTMGCNGWPFVPGGKV